MNEILKQYRQNHREDLIPCMQQLQDRMGYISVEAIDALAGHFGLPATKVYGIATFYDYFTFAPTGSHVVKICNGTSCHMQGSGKIIREAEKVVQQINQQSRSKTCIRVCECQGACNAGPIMQVDDTVLTRVTVDMVRASINRTNGKQKGGGHE